MYSFMNLGNFGRLGNQMFQYSALFSLASKNNAEFLIPDTKIVNNKYEKYELLQEFKNLSANIVTFHNPKLRSIKQRYYEKTFSYDELFFSIKMFTDLHGYFQSENYFKLFKQDLKKEFLFSNNVVDNCKSKISEYKRNNVSLCSIHIRRGDYTNLKDYHTNLSIIEYYKPSMNLMLEKNKNIKFVIFSDDIDWCRKTGFFQENCIYLNMKNHFEDLYVMTQCDYHIIANSSFSWWGSYLSNSQLTIAPEKWFGPQGPNNWDSIYCNNWHVI